MRQAPTESFGPYLVHEVIGIGGMASVHRAEKAGLPTIALKRMLPQYIVNDEAVAAFVREARLAHMMSHPNLAKTYEVGRIADTYFIAMELISGRTLSDLMLHQPIPLDVALNLVAQLCDALHYAHTLTDPTGEPLGIIHRDVSPSNLVVADDGVAKLIDFGVAKGAAVGMQTLGITMKGKFGYMAPEYLVGKLDSRADLFAVGIIAHELLTGQPLFTRDDELETMTRLRDLEIPLPSATNAAVPPEIDNIVMVALARDPDARWQHAAELRDALAAAAAHLEIAPTRDAVVAWIAQAFGETLTFDAAPAAAPPLGLALPPQARAAPAAEPPAATGDELELLPEERPVVRITKPPPMRLPTDDWARETAINRIIGSDLGHAGAEPVSLEDSQPAALPLVVEEPQDRPLPPPSVIVIAPKKSRRRLLIIAISLVVAGLGIAAVMLFGGCGDSSKPTPAPTPTSTPSLPPIPETRDPESNDPPSRVEAIARLGQFRDPKSPYDCTILSAMLAHFATTTPDLCLEPAIAPSCVATAIAAKRPMVFAQVVRGEDSSVFRAYATMPEAGGLVGYFASYDSNPCGGGCEDRGVTYLSRCTAPPTIATDCMDGLATCLACKDSTFIDTCRNGKPSAMSLADAERTRDAMIATSPATAWTAMSAGLATIEATGIVWTAPLAGSSRGFAHFWGSTPDSIVMSFAGPCAALHDRIVRAWGPPDPDGLWVDAAAHVRASFFLQDCDLTVERTIELPAWVALARTQRTEGTIAGIGRGTGPTIVTVSEDDGQIDVRGTTDRATFDKLAKLVPKGAASFSDDDHLFQVTFSHPRR